MATKKSINKLTAQDKKDLEKIKKQLLQYGFKEIKDKAVEAKKNKRTNKKKEKNVDL